MAIIKSKKRLPGIHPAYHKHTMDMETAMLPVPATVSIPMLQHIGAEAVPVVKPGERVLAGQKIGDSDAPMGVPVHASVSGTVKQIGSMLTSGGKTVKTVVIEADGQQEAFSGACPCPSGKSGSLPSGSAGERAGRFGRRRFSHSCQACL